MTEEELKNSWKARGPKVHIKKGLTDELAQALQKTDKQIRMRNNRELGAAAILIPCMALMGWYIHPLLSRIGAFLTIPCTIFIIVIIRRVRSHQVQDVSLPLKDYLLQYRYYMYREQWLLSSVAWWYIAPLMVCFTLIFMGMHHYWQLIPAATLAIFLWYINRKAARDYFAPILRRIDSDIAALDENNDPYL